MLSLYELAERGAAPFSNSREAHSDRRSSPLLSRTPDTALDVMRIRISVSTSKFIEVVLRLVPRRSLTSPTALCMSSPQIVWSGRLMEQRDPGNKATAAPCCRSRAHRNGPPALCPSGTGTQQLQKQTPDRDKAGEVE